MTNGMLGAVVFIIIGFAIYKSFQSLFFLNEKVLKGYLIEHENTRKN